MKELQVFSNFIFIEKNHKYRYLPDPDLILTPSTRYKAKFVPPFRSNYWLLWSVLKDHFDRDKIESDFRMHVPKDHYWISGKNYHIDELWPKYDALIGAKKNEWDILKREGQERGNAIHDFLEYAFSRKIRQAPVKYRNPIYQAYRYWSDHKDDGISVTEFVVGSVEWGVAGMIDRIEFPFDAEPGEVDIIDYKTDQEFTSGFDDAFGRYLLPPFEMIPHNSLGEYTIQVNIYRELLELSGLKVRRMIIVNITDDNYFKYKVDKINVLT